MSFELHARLQQDCFAVGRFALCRVLLMNDANYPWFVLVPQRPDVREIHDLNAPDRLQLMTESCAFAVAMARAYEPDKLNVASLGNVVPQLHVHHIARYRDDPAWPAPVWGVVAPRPYAGDERHARLARLRAALTGEFQWESGT